MTASQEPSSLIRAIEPFDTLETEHRRDALAWIGTGAPLYRVIQRPPTPAKHLVSYVVPVDVQRRRLMLIEHKRSGLLLPPGGHVEPGESMVKGAERECQEELGIPARWDTPAGNRPLFVTVTETRPSPRQDVHTDVSLWFVIALCSDEPIQVEEREIAATHWLDFETAVQADATTVDPHLPRFLTKLAALTG